jgi:putative addiction module component (TIGR02574 family)
MRIKRQVSNPVARAVLNPEIAKLSLAERIQLVEDLWDSIAEETQGAMKLSQAQTAEIEQRLREHEADPSSVVSWERVRAELFQGKA